MSILAHSVVTKDGASPGRAMLFLHGILGSGVNLRSLARTFVDRRPDWAALLVDLRNHGDSRGLPPPHTVASAAADLDGLGTEWPVRGAVGHSFGGKVALRWAAGQEKRPDELWLIDTMPGVRDRLGTDSVAAVIDALESIAYPLPSRDAFVAALAERGIDRRTALWLGKNLERDDAGRVALAIDLGAVRAMLEDYLALDLWHLVETPPAEALHLVVGGASHAFSAADRARAERIAQTQPAARLHVIEKAGHWVHVDAPETLANLLAGE